MEINTLAIWTRVHVLGNQLTVLSDIGSRVSNRDGTKVTSFLVSLHVSNGGLDPCSGGSVGFVVNDLVAGKVGHGANPWAEDVHGGEDVLEITLIVGRGWIVTVDGVEWGVDLRGSCMLVKSN